MNIKRQKNAETTNSGFTLMELLVTIGMMSILVAISIPAFTSWRQSAQNKQATDGVLSAMRKARHGAIAMNLQNRVECSGNKYRITQGNRSYNSNSWTTVKQDWTTLPTGMTMQTGDLAGACTNAGRNIEFEPNGTASQGKICISDNTSNQYQVQVSTSGRIQSIKQ